MDKINNNILSNEVIVINDDNDFLSDNKTESRIENDSDNEKEENSINKIRNTNEDNRFTSKSETDTKNKNNKDIHLINNEKLVDVDREYDNEVVEIINKRKRKRNNDEENNDSIDFEMIEPLFKTIHYNYIKFLEFFEDITK